MDLDSIATDLRRLEQRLERQVAPVRTRLAWLGPAGLYALAAQELQAAQNSADPQQAGLHHRAACAAETLADQLLQART